MTTETCWANDCGHACDRPRDAGNAYGLCASHVPDPKEWTALDLVREDLPLCVVRAFSKAWSMAGARLGYVVAPSWVVANLEKVVLPYHLDAGKQAAGRLALAHVDEMDARVKQIEDRLARAQVADNSSLPEDMVFIGATVKLREIDTGDEDLYRIVGEATGNMAADYLEVTVNSPLGSSLMKSRVGGTVRVDLPRGEARYLIVEIVG